MKLEVGMYVRCVRPFGAKIPSIARLIENINNSDIWALNTKQDILETDILKASHNIIDLIEVGDYVNGYKVEDFDITYFNGVDRREIPKRLAAVIDININMGFRTNMIKNEEIKTVLTKEQFESMNFRVD